MKFLIYTAVFLALLSSCKKELTEPNSIKEAADQIIYPHIALGSNAGIIAGIIHNGKTETYSYGEKELGKREPITDQTTLEIASLTKVFTALALADMVSKGEVKLDDPIEKHLPSSIIIPSKNGIKITFKHLATHTSGLPRLADNMDEDAYNPYKDYSENDMIEFLASYSLTAEPGSSYEYSNIGFGLLGYVLSHINKTDYETLITNRVLKPLNMTQTFVNLTNARKANQAPGYNGSKRAEPWAQYQQISTQGSGALNSNMHDLLLFLKANIDPGSTPLKSAVQLIQTPAAEHSSWKQDGMALGWEYYNLNGDIIIWKNGLNGSYSSFMGFNTSTGTGVTVLSNTSLAPDLITSNIGFELLKKLKKIRG